MKKLILFFALVFTYGVWAQDQQSNAPEQEAQNNEQGLDTDLTPEELAAAENDELVLENSAGDEEQEQSNSRFIPTEQISQDLGVSFPVDI
ncbi:MAG: hypothetical protein OXU66_09465 [Gammaproteobacteria bacterium]|nr:hypothetical protein [Gammaproteobacteria bacterium]MDD9897218.1 hypothetical protein [Gammaproteobacteria bacterium]MDD9959159.1 hypothetical protein [Gammaproteobacteria bacterium]